MALNPNELFSSNSANDATRTIAHRVIVGKFKQGSGTLSVNAPLAYSTDDDMWVPYDAAGGPAGADSIRGFLFPDELTLDSDEEVLGQILVEGILHIDDILAATSEADASVKADLQANARALGLHIQGLVNVR